MLNPLRVLWLWLSTAFKASPGLAILLFVNAAASSALAPLTSLGVAMAISAATDHRSVVPGITLTAVMVLFSTLLNNFARPAGDTADEKVMLYVMRDIMTMISGIGSMSHHEDPALADKLGALRREVWQLGSIFRAMTVVGTVVGTITVATLLISVHPLMVLLLPIAMIPTGLSAWFSVRQRQLWKSKEADRRLAEKLLDQMRTPEAAVELRSFGLGRVLLGRAGTAFDSELAPLRRHMIRGAVTVTVASGLAWACYLAAMAWMIWRVADGRASVGAVALLIMLAQQIRTTAASITANVQLVINSLDTFGRYQWLKNYAKANDWSGSVGKPPARLSQVITLDHVTFHYPSNEQNQRTTPSLDNVSLHLPAGSTVAFVGDNGAGKSTMVKLLARLYDPTSGQILIDGTRLSDVDPDAWHLRTSAGFQDFARLEFITEDAIGVADLTQRDRGQIEQAAAHGQADTVIAGLPEGFDTQLGTQFSGGVGLSGGQWQRIALARAMVRPEPLLMVLDEPTAALDPEAEHAIYDRYATAARQVAARTGGVTVLVSHRFSTVRMADLIVVLSGGQIVEQGTHEQLLAAGGRYADLFSLQAAAYR